MKLKILLIIIIVFCIAVVGIYLSGAVLKERFFRPVTTTSPPQNASQPEQSAESLAVVVSNLEIPWEVAFLPAGQMLLTERPGNLYLRESGNKLAIEGVTAAGEGGLLGIAIHPDFSNNKFIYLYLTTRQNGQIVNRVDRYKFDGQILSARTEIIGKLPGASYHNGGRIAFGPDGMLYITTGDAENSSLAQDINSLAGKILRIKDDGSIPEDNPFANAVYSYGHRNPQGLAWDDQNRLWATEHGRSGTQSGFDEINLIEPGANYGWPLIQRDEEQEGIRQPIAHSGPNETWAPAGMIFYQGRFFSPA